jgi:hypothetical protein
MPIKPNDIELFSTIGIELTYALSPFIHRDLDEIIGRLQRITCYTKIKRDCGVIEIPTPIFDDVDTLVSFVKYIENYTDKFELKRRVLIKIEGEEGFLLTGGGHINFGLQRMNSEEAKVFFYKVNNFLYANPYIAWIFAEGGDVDINHNYKEARYQSRGSDHTGIISYDYTSSSKPEFDPVDFNCGVYGRIDDNQSRIELRFFNMFKNIQDMINCIAFANSLLIHIRDIEEMPEQNDYIHSYEKYIKGTPEDCVIAFEELCEKLDIDPSLFNEQIKYGLYDRWEHKETCWK